MAHTGGGLLPRRPGDGTHCLTTVTTVTTVATFTTVTTVGAVGGGPVIGATRTLVVWCADWPVVAAGVPLDLPAAVLHANRVVACSPAARAEGRASPAPAGRSPAVPSWCSSTTTRRPRRAFEPVPSALEALTPACEISYPGRAPSPPGDRPATTVATALAERAAALGPRRRAGVVPCRWGSPTAPSPLRWPRAAALPPPLAGTLRRGWWRGRPGGGGVRVVPPGRAPASWRPCRCGPSPSRAVRGARPVDVLERLGLRTLGDLAALAAEVVGRFGAEGRTARGWPGGSTSGRLSPRPPPAELTMVAEIDPPAERVEAAAFVARAWSSACTPTWPAWAAPAPGWSSGPRASTARRTNGCGARGRSRPWPSPTGCAGSSTGGCTPGPTARRPGWSGCGWRPTRWCRPVGISSFGTGGPGGRRRRGGWRAAGAGPGAGTAGRRGRAGPRVAGRPGPGRARGPGGGGGRRRHRAPAGGPVRLGGRALAWDGARPGAGHGARPPLPVQVLDAAGHPVRVGGGRGEVSAAPARVRWVVSVKPTRRRRQPGPARRRGGEHGGGRPPRPGTGAGARSRGGPGAGRPGVGRAGGPVGGPSWRRAGPWPCDERWWDPRGHRRRARLQVTTAGGVAYLLVVESGRWAVEATYDWMGLPAGAARCRSETGHERSRDAGAGSAQADGAEDVGGRVGVARVGADDHHDVARRPCRRPRRPRWPATPCRRWSTVAPHRGDPHVSDRPARCDRRG